MSIWNPWHGCHKVSPGCAHCYMFRRDADVGRDSTQVTKTASFSLPRARRRDGSYKLQGTDVVYACMTSDFFVEEADAWRAEAWAMMRERADLSFQVITKRPERFFVELPADWGKTGYPNVTLCVTAEDQRRADERVGLLLDLPVAHRHINSEPMLGPIDLTSHLRHGLIEQVTVGGESGPEARVLDYAWVLDVRAQCLAAHVPFHFRQTGALFVKDGRTYHIRRAIQLDQARRAGIDHDGWER